MNRGQSIRLFLVDGTSNGLWTAEIMGKTIRATVAPRNTLAALAERPEVQKTGVYVLGGTDQENPLRQVIYIGQSENVWERLRQHDSDSKKDFWERTIIFTSTDTNLTKAHILYLESRLITLSNISARSKVENGNSPSLPALPESDQAYMEEWLDWIKILLPVLGYNFAMPVPVLIKGNQTDDTTSEAGDGLKLYMDKVGVNARLHEVNGEWIIVAGSTLRKEVKDSLPDSLVKLRESLITEGIIVDDAFNTEYLKFTRNYPASSLSMASSLIGGATYSGTGSWIVEATNEPYYLWRQRQLDEAEKQLISQED
jgi:hypothetical protein